MSSTPQRRMVLADGGNQSIFMNEGWYADDYLILYAEAEVPVVSEHYEISTLLPGYEVVGLRGWDDFIVRDSKGGTFSVPTVPLESRYMSPFSMPEAQELRADERFAGKIKWYVKPILFGGNPSAEENLIWVAHEQHTQLVRWWNDQYRSLYAFEAVSCRLLAPLLGT